MTVNSDQNLSELLNQSNAEPSTPELPSGTSLEERFPEPITNKSVESTGLDNEEPPILSSIGTDLTFVIESEDVTLTIKLMVKSNNADQSCNPSIEEHLLAPSPSKIVD